MTNPYLYTEDFPEAHRIINSDIISLFHNKNWDALDEVVVCRDKHGKVTARFGDDVWNLQPYARSKDKYNIKFKDWSDTPELQTELKLLAYGWLHHKVVKGNAPKYTTICHKVCTIKVTFHFLKQIKATSLADLSKTKNFEEFKNFLIARSRSQGNLEKIFTAINNAIALEPWLQFSFGFSKKLEPSHLSKEMSNKDPQQTLAIPERLSDEIYGKAIDLIETAFPQQHLIANIESELQHNYTEGKAFVDSKIRSGSRFSCTDDMGQVTDRHKYALLINDNLRRHPKEIVAPLSNQITGITINNAVDFQRYLGQLITACYIACGGFSGMRESELEKLSPDSYYKDHFNGRDFHMLQSSTFKLGEKRETWVAAPIVEKAIALMSTLSEAWRKSVKYPDERYPNTLWCNQGARSRSPALITQWNKRLERFCKHFGFVVTKEDYQECIESNPNSLDRIKNRVVIGKPWPLATHQFRRSLAFYTIKHRLGTKVALKQQFKHLYLSMTEWYTNGGQLASLRDLAVDKKVQQALDEINAEMTASKIFKQWHSNEPLSGSMGKAIVKMRGDVPHIYSSWETIYEAVKKGTLTLHGTAHSYCKNGYDCDMDGVVMPQFCVDCSGQGSIIDKDQALWWQKKHKSLVRYMALGEDISVTDKSHYITQIRAAENVMADFDMPFTPFEPDLKVTNL